MSGEGMTQRVGMNLFLEARLLGGSMAGVPDGFRIDGLIAVVPAVARKQPLAWLSSQPVPMCPQLVEQL
jgi:hypothetical protein